jgi:hypothetical protein
MGEPRYPALDTLAWRLFVGGLCVHFLFSTHALLILGYPYEGPLPGPFPFKIHPGTYLTGLSLLCSLASRGNPLRSLWIACMREPLLALNLAVMVSCLGWVLLRHGTSGAAFIVDTHWLPSIAAFALLHFDDRRRAFLLKLLLLLIAANALLALGEYAAKERLTPLFLQGPNGGFSVEDHFRSSALLGHPLENAMITATLLPIALLMPGRALWRWLHVVLLLLAMLAFGGRASLFTALLIYGGWAALQLTRQVLRGRFSYLQLTGGSALLLLCLAALAGFVVVTGLGERIFASLYLDNSAGVRLRVWSAYDYLNAEELWLGISARGIDDVAVMLGLDPEFEAIENGWIYLSMLLGLPVFLLWVFGFGCLYGRLFREAPALVRVALVIYLVSASTTNLYGAKSINQGLITTYVLAAAAVQRRRAGERWAQGRVPGSRLSVRDLRAGWPMVGAPRAPLVAPHRWAGLPDVPARSAPRP